MDRKAVLLLGDLTQNHLTQASHPLLSFFQLPPQDHVRLLHAPMYQGFILSFLKTSGFSSHKANKVNSYMVVNTVYLGLMTYGQGWPPFGIALGRSPILLSGANFHPWELMAPS
jgi:hypothetical protein